MKPGHSTVSVSLPVDHCPGRLLVKRDQRSDGFINLPVSAKTRAGLHLLKDVMGVRSQAEVLETLVAMGVAMNAALHDK